MTDNEVVLERMLNAYNDGDADGVVAEAADDVEYVLGSRDLRLVGRDAWKSVVNAVTTAMPGRRMQVSRRVVSDEAAVIEWVIDGVSSGQVPGYPAAGESVRRAGCSVIGFRDGHIVSFRDYLD